jgi:ribosomal protein S18 acetylase RimI-like enzyme
MIRFRSAELEDADKIVELVNSAYRGDSSRVGWTTEADFLDGQRTDSEKISELIASLGVSIELAIENQQVIGCVQLRKEPEGVLYFGMLTVKPDIQSQGIGKLLLERIESIAKRGKCKKIRIHVIHLRNELIAFYERRGFKKTGKSEAFPQNDPRFGIPKVSGLTLVEFEKLI